MLLEDLVWNSIGEFCEKNSLSRYRRKMTNICSQIILFSERERITFFIESMEHFLYVKVEFLNSENKTSTVVTIDDRTSEVLVSLRKKWIQSLRQSTKKRAFDGMMQEYIQLIQKAIDAQRRLIRDNVKP